MKKIQYNGESKLLSGIATKINWLIDQVGTKIDASEKGVANGVATLDGGGKVPSSQLPSYVDDVVEGYYYNSNFYEDSAHTELITPETSKIYVDLPTSKTYRWGGSEYVEISSGADEKVKQTPYIADAETREILLAKSTDGYEHTEGTYKTSALKFFYGGNGLGILYIGDYDSQYGYYNGEVHCKWVDCQFISGLNNLVIGDSQNSGSIDIYDSNGNIAELIPNLSMQNSLAIYLPASDGTLALQSEIPQDYVSWQEQNLLGAKNLLPHPYQDRNVTSRNGIDFLTYDYYVYVGSGSPTGNTNWYFVNKKEFLPSGNYIVSGFNDTAQGNNFCLRVVINQDMSTERQYNDYGSGTEITVNYGDVVSVYFHMTANGVSSGNYHWIMIRPSSVLDSEYQKPTLTNRQLTETKLDKSGILLYSEDLNNITDVGFYTGISGNTCANKPSGFLQFGLYVIRTATSGTGNYYKQILIRPNASGETWSRNCVNGTWSAWKKDIDNSDITDVVRWSENNCLGAKNLFPYPYQDTTNTTNGITFTDNGDGTVTVSGTASANTRFSFDNYATNDPINFPLPGGQKYIVSRGYTETTNAYMFIRVFYTANLSDSESVLVELKNSDEVLDLTNYPTIYGFRSQIVVANGTAITTPITFKPMIRLESITDDTYVPFGMTNIALTNNKFEKTAKTQPSGQDLNDYKETGIYYFNTSGATNVPIGSNGMLLVFKANWDSVGIFVKQIWMRHGTQNGNDYQTYIRTYRSDNGGSWSDWHRLITQEGGTFDKHDGTTTAVGDTWITLGNSTASGTAGNSRGRIQIYGADNHYTNLRAQDSTSGDVASYLPAVRGTLAVENTYMTAKNLLPLKTWSKNGLVSGNATFTVNGDGTITVNRTTTTGTGTFYITEQQENGGLWLPNGTYILSGCPQGGSTSTSSGYQLGVRCYKNGATVSFGNDGGDGLEFTVDGDDFSNDGAWIRTIIVFRGGASANNLVFKPMIMPKTFTDKSFTPPAKTNADLTAQAQGILDMIATTEPSNSASKAYAVGDYMIWKGKFYKVTTAISSGGTISTSKLTETTLGAELKSALT